MSVVSFEFLGFLAALAVVYYVLPMRVRKWALLAGSAAFWLLCGWQGAAYLTAETLLIWGCARLMGRFSERRGVCRALLVGGMVTVFGAMVLMKAFGWLRTMAAVLLAQFFACTTSPGMAFGMMGRIFTDFGAGMTRNFPLGMQDGAVAIIAVLLMLLVDILCEKQPDLRKKLAVSPLYVRWTLLMGLMFLTLIFGCYGAGFDRAAFLYAGF